MFRRRLTAACPVVHVPGPREPAPLHLRAHQSTFCRKSYAWIDFFSWLFDEKYAQ